MTTPADLVVEAVVDSVASVSEAIAVGNLLIMGGPAGRFDVSAAGIVTGLPGGSVHDWSSGSRTVFDHAVQSAAR